MSDRPYNTLKPEARLAEQERRYRERMGAEKAERQKALAEAERKQKQHTKPTDKPGNKKRAGKRVSHAKKPYGSRRRLIPDDGYDARSEARYGHSDTDAQTEQVEAARWATESGGDGLEA